VFQSPFVVPTDIIVLEAGANVGEPRRTVASGFGCGGVAWPVGMNAGGSGGVVKINIHCADRISRTGRWY